MYQLEIKFFILQLLTIGFESLNFKSESCDYCENTELVPTHPSRKSGQEVKIALDIDTISFESPEIYRIDYSIRSRWVVNETYCRFYLDYLKYHGYFSESDENYDHEDNRLVITADVAKNFIWTPDTTCLSARDEEEPSSTEGTLSVVTLESDDDDPQWPKQVICKMELLRKVFAVSTCALDLKKYPVDNQKCGVKFGSFILNEADVTYNWRTNDPITLHNESKLNQYNVFKTETTNGTRGMFDETYTTISCVFNLHRYLLSSFIGMYIPSLLICALSWLSLWISPLTPPARANLLVTSLLALLTQFTASRAGTTTSDITFLDVWFLVCFAYVFAALIQFTIVKTITTDFDDQETLRQEDEEFQDKHKAKENAGGIAKMWKSKTKRDGANDFDNVQPLTSQMDKRVSIPFMNVPAATRLRSNIPPIYEQISENKYSLADEDFYSIRRLKQSYDANYCNDSDTPYSLGLRSISITDSVFNSPDSSHFHYSPDIIKQKAWMLSDSVTGYTGGNLQTFSKLRKNGSKLSYLSPMAPDYVERNLSILSRSFTRSTKISSDISDPSSFHSSKWYYQLAKHDKQNTVKDFIPSRNVNLNLPKCIREVTKPFHEKKQINGSSKKEIPSKKVMMRVDGRIRRKSLVKRIERWSRILFPLTFIFFNLFYWPYIYNY